ncbi:unnamed protein product, partial [Pylaiella littoralis]
YYGRPGRGNDHFRHEHTQEVHRLPHRHEQRHPGSASSTERQKGRDRGPGLRGGGCNCRVREYLVPSSSSVRKGDRRRQCRKPPLLHYHAKCDRGGTRAVLSAKL